MAVWPSILFFLAVYGLYALVLAWCRRKRFRFQERATPRPRWLMLARGGMILLLFGGLVFWLKPESENKELRLASMLGLTANEELKTRPDLSPVTIPPLKEVDGVRQPVYAVLHPESPPTLLPSTKLPVAPQVRKGKGLVPLRLGLKNPKNDPSGKGGEKASARSKSKKPKSSNPPGGRGRASSESQG